MSHELLADRTWQWQNGTILHPYKFFGAPKNILLYPKKTKSEIFNFMVYRKKEIQIWGKAHSSDGTPRREICGTWLTYVTKVE